MIFRQNDFIGLKTREIEMLEICLKTEKHAEFVDITEEVRRNIPRNFRSGVCHVYSPHTTAGLTINENADPSVLKDIINQLDKMVPWNNSYTHGEGNSAAHIKASFMGFAQSVPVEDGRLRLGTWQGIFFCEFDGPRTRRVEITFIKNE